MKIEIFGVGVDNDSWSEVTDKLEGFLSKGKKYYIVTPNPEMIVQAQKDEEFKKILSSSDLAIPDGVGLIWAAKVLNLDLKEKITGTDLAEKICELSAKKSYRIFFLGGKDNIGLRAKKNLEDRYPGLNIVGTDCGQASLKDEDRIIQKINRNGPIDFLLVAFGAPKQEKWIVRNLDRLNVRVALGVGGALDYFAKEKRRAPKWLRDRGLEWLFRLILEPKRIRRQARLPVFVYLILSRKLKSL